MKETKVMDLEYTTSDDTSSWETQKDNWDTGTCKESWLQLVPEEEEDKYECKDDKSSWKHEPKHDLVHKGNLWKHSHSKTIISSTLVIYTFFLF